MADLSKKYVMETFKGKGVNLALPTVADIDIYDIAHSLAYTYRYGGHADPGISVAEHSIAAEFYAHHILGVKDPITRMAVFMHDAHEAYWGDQIRPWKQVAEELAPELKEQEKFLIKIVESYIHPLFPSLMTPETRNIVKKVDLVMMAIEAHVALPSKGEHWSAIKMSQDEIRGEINKMLEDGFYRFPMCLEPKQSSQKFVNRFQTLLKECYQIPEFVFRESAFSTSS